MPFIPMNERPQALSLDLNEPGHRCYRHFQAFMDVWNKEPRWATIDKYAQRIWGDDEQRAAALALLVAMHKVGFAYEDAQEKKNGSVK